MGLENEKGLKTRIENNVFRAYDIRKGYKNKLHLKAKLNVNADKGERVYYIGVWDELRVISKIKDNDITVCIILNESDDIIKKFVTDTPGFENLIEITTERFGDPNNKSDYRHCKTSDEVLKEMDKDNILK